MMHLQASQDMKEPSVPMEEGEAVAIARLLAFVMEDVRQTGAAESYELLRLALTSFVKLHNLKPDEFSACINAN